MVMIKNVPGKIKKIFKKDETPALTWICSNCGKENSVQQNKCSNCGKGKK
jgi:ribosomal protein L37E